MLNSANAPELSSAQLALALEAGEPIQLVDVRAPARVATGRIDLVPEERFHNIVGSQLVRHSNLASTGLDPDIPVVVVCGHGNDSRVIALFLNRLGADASSLRGGMVAWMNLCVARELEPPSSLDRLVQLDRIGKGALGYLLVSDGEALIVDPPRDAAAYLEAARESGARIAGVADTHVHADYISGASSIAKTLEVPYYLHPADAIYPYDGRPGRLDFQPVEDGNIIEFGRCSLRALHTPGHTEGSLSFAIDGAATFTGDFVFISSVGRPDLAGKVSEWAEQLWESVETAKSEWPVETMIYPAHYGSELERRADRSVGQSLERLLQDNEALRFAHRDAFVAWVESKTTSFPDAYRKIKAVNVGLLPVSEPEAEELEVGKNECALGGA